MCGVFGLVSSKKLRAEEGFYINCISELFKYSASRGVEASGLSVKSQDLIKVVKSPLSPKKLIRSKEYSELFSDIKIDKNGVISSPISIMGHSRLVTDGSQEIHENNQPVIKNGTVCIHNGIVTNVNALWQGNEGLKRTLEIDTEIISSLIKNNLKESRNNITIALKNTFEAIYGMTSIAMFFDNSDILLIATNNGSLYIGEDTKSKMIFFASEEYILKSLSKKLFFRRKIKNLKVKKIIPGSGYVISIDNLKKEKQDFLNYNGKNATVINKKENIEIKDIKPKNISYAELGSGYKNANLIKTQIPKDFDEEFEKTLNNTNHLKRCKKCVLPETMPFIVFNKEGICNYCIHYKPFHNKNEDDFEELLDKYRFNEKESRCIVAFSGGRDSSFGLHLLKNKYGLNPITFTYDWGMLTDLSRRNQSRICGKLGLENILVSANIKNKRLNIRKNVIAWLNKPELGMIPLFMAGDKQFFYYVNQIKKQTGIDLNIWMANKLEETNFKVGFSGVVPDFRKDEIHQLFASQKLKLTYYYLKNFIRNTKYINSSLFDTFGAYYSYYFQKREGYVNLFDYHSWDEDIIEKVLINEYGWELSPDTNSTWRIGDGTAPFYNFIYLTIAGFTENDTFRSNQIREGKISREVALSKLKEENSFPRWDSIKWYCDVIGIDFYSTIQRINRINKIYIL
tara:strand:+ start:2589 stop:4637 length:2049 start_codon:yes stop_codon:yes gene_type:complete